MAYLKNMSKKEKMEYIWDYYKLHIIGTLLLILFVGSFVYGQLTKVEYVSNLTLIGSGTNQTKLEEFEKKLTALVVKESEKRKQASVDFVPSDKSGIKPEFNQRFIVRVSAGEVGVVVLDKNLYENLLKQGMFLKLDNLSDLSLSNIKNTKFEGSTEQQGSGIYAVSVEGNKTLQDLGYDTNNKVMGIISSSNQNSNDIKVFKWLLGVK